MKTTKLNLGCGEDYKKGWINVDSRKNIKADFVYDLDKFPYPFKENSFNEILASHILEHLKGPIATLKELIRISKDGARIVLRVPHAFSYANVTDLQHKINFTENSFSDNHLKEYELEELHLERLNFLFPNNKWKKYIPLKKYLKIFFIGVYDDIQFEFKVRK